MLQRIALLSHSKKVLGLFLGQGLSVWILDDLWVLQVPPTVQRHVRQVHMLPECKLSVMNW